jgi:opacity protein-like surface antigen
MKTLSTLAVLSLTAAAQAITLDVNAGHSTPKNYDDVNVIGFGIGTQLNNELHLGFNLAQKNLTDIAIVGPGGVEGKARSLSVDLTYRLSQGGIRPFIGAGVGGVHFSGPSIDSANALTTKLFAGIGFQISQNVELILSAQNSQYYSVHKTAGDAGENITSWDAIAGLRFSF